MSHKQLSGIILVILAVLLLGLIPVVGTYTTGNATDMYSQSINETITLQDSYYSNLNSIDMNGNATIRVYYNGSSYDSVTKTLENDTFSVYTVNSNNINVSYEKQLSNTEIFVSYEYDKYLGYPSIIELILSNTAIILISLVLLIILVILLQIFEGEK